MRKLKHFICFLMLSLLFVSKNVMAKDVTFEATVDSTNVVLGSSFELTLTVEGTQDLSPITLPAMGSFQANYLGPESRFEYINGKVSSSIAFHYSLVPLRVGSFEIPAIEATIDGKVYKTQPIAIEVVDQPSPPAGSSGAGPASAAKSLQDKVFLVLKVAKNEVFLGEKVPVKVLLFVNNLSVRLNPVPQIEGVGFSAEEFGKPMKFQQNVGGVAYNIVEFDTFIYPTRTGEVKLGPGKLDVAVVVENPRAKMTQFFDDDFFNSFISPMETHEIALQSADVTLNVLPLPEEGKPANFSGAVGKYSFEATAAPLEVKEGDPITLKMKVSGEGNLKTVQFPTVNVGDNFKLYDPQVKEENKVKTYEQVVIPKNVQVQEIPVLEFNYFDSEIKKYVTLVQGPFPIKVTKSDNTGSSKIVDNTTQSSTDISKTITQEPESFGKDIVFIKDDVGDLQKVGGEYYRSPLFYIFIFIGLIGLIAGILFHQRYRRLQTDTAYARKIMAPAEAKKGLAQAKSFMVAEKNEAFYDAIFKTLQQYLANKLHIPAGMVSAVTVIEKVQGKNLRADILEDLKLIWDRCEAIRYAPSSVGLGQMPETFTKCEQIIDHFERNLK